MHIFKLKKGYTLVEILVGITIIGVVFGVGFASFRGFARRQAVASAIRSLKSDLRLAQAQALAGKKPAHVNCNSPNVLDGYNFEITAQDVYRVRARCSNGNVEIKQVQLANIAISAPNPNPILFKVLGQGTNITQGSQAYFILSETQTGFSMAVAVTSSGEIKDSAVPTPTAPTTPTLTPTPTPISGPTATPTPVTPTFNPVADSFGDSGSPASNFGLQTTLEVDGSPAKIAYLKFDLTSLAGKTVNSAKFRFRVCTTLGCDSGATQNVKAVDDTSWGETTITYNNRPSLGATQATNSGGALGEWKEVDITSYVASKVGGLMSLGIDSTGGDGFDVYSRETVGKPELVVVYTNPISTPTPTPTRTPTPTFTPTPTPVPSGSINASPNPCSIPFGFTTCSSTISWSTSNASSVEIWIDNNSSNIFATGNSGNGIANFIDSGGYWFYLKGRPASGGSIVTLATVFVDGTAGPTPTNTSTPTPTNTSTPTPTPTPMFTLTPTPTFTPTPTPTPSGVNLVSNPGFESGTTSWSFNTDGAGNFSATTPSYEGSLAARISISTPGTNVQLFQFNLSLEATTNYRLEFAARSNSGHDLSVYIHQHVSPFTNYGLSNFVVDLTSSWQTFSTTFTSTNSTPVNDARLRFWFSPYDAAGDEYWIDSVVLVKL